jgi:hypothetical protein
MWDTDVACFRYLMKVQFDGFERLRQQIPVGDRQHRQEADS